MLSPFPSFFKCIDLAQYATTGWATSGSGVTAKRALIIAVGPGLAGVFFPLTGLPDLPKAAAPPSLPFNPPLSLMAQMQNLGNLNQQQRDAVLAQMQQLKQAHAAVSYLDAPSYG